MTTTSKERSVISVGGSYSRCGGKTTAWITSNICSKFKSVIVCSTFFSVICNLTILVPSLLFGTKAAMQTTMAKRMVIRNILPVGCCGGGKVVVSGREVS